MKKLLATCAIAALGLGLQGAALAQSNTSGSATGSAAMSTPSAQPASAATNITAGQMVYDSSGAEIGSIKSVTTDSAGQKQAVVGVGKFLGLGTKDVEIPASKLSARSAGGYTTSLSSAEIKNLPEAPKATSTSPK
jgi:PRC-barrel domain